MNAASTYVTPQYQLIVSVTIPIRLCMTNTEWVLQIKYCKNCVLAFPNCTRKHTVLLYNAGKNYAESTEHVTKKFLRW